MKRILFLFLLVCANLLAEDPFIPAPKAKTMIYVTTGVGPLLITPSVGAGYRSRHGSFGVDISLSTSTLYLIVSEIQGTIDLTYTPTPSWDNPFYTGLGIAGGCYLSRWGGVTWSVSPDFVVGKEFTGFFGVKQFVELRAQVPHWSPSENDISLFPATYMSYGIGF